MGLLLQLGVGLAARKPAQLQETPAPRMHILEALQEAKNQPILDVLVDSMCK